MTNFQLMSETIVMIHTRHLDRVTGGADPRKRLLSNALGKQIGRPVSFNGEPSFQSTEGFGMWSTSGKVNDRCGGVRSFTGLVDTERRRVTHLETSPTQR